MSTFDMTFTFRVNPGTSDPAKVEAHMEQYLRDMLYVGAETEADDIFSLEEVEREAGLALVIEDVLDSMKLALAGAGMAPIVQDALVAEVRDYVERRYF